MGTRSNIGYKDKKSGKYHYVYCHWDGYYEGVGNDLLNGFNSYSKAKELVDGGDMSTTEEPYTSKGEDYEDLKPRITDNQSDIFQQEYAYVFTEDGWLGTHDGVNFKPLENLV